MEITYVRANNYDATPAIPRALEAAQGVFSDISIIAWNRHGFINKNELVLNPSIRLFRLVRSAPPRSLKVFLLTLWFQLWVFKSLVRIKPDYVQALEIESAIPSIIFCILFRKQMIYDIRDPFALVYQHRPIVKMFSYFIDWVIIALSRAIILPNSNLIFYLGRWTKHSTYIIPNTCHDYHSRLDENKKLISKISAVEGITLGYLGYMIEQRGSLFLLDLIDSVQDISLVIAGSVRDPELRQSYINHPKILYLGELSYLDALTVMKHVDYIPTVYDPEVPVHKDLMPTKFYEAMMAGTPIIVSEGMDLLESTITTNGLGFSTKYNDVKEIENKIRNNYHNMSSQRMVCREYYLKHLSLEKHIIEYQRFYLSILEN